VVEFVEVDAQCIADRCCWLRGGGGHRLAATFTLQALDTGTIDVSVKAEVGGTAVGWDGTVIEAFSERVVARVGESLVQVLN
jgi:hypothetical protein